MIAQEFGLSVAKKLSQARDEEWPAIFDDLRRRQQLSDAVREINELITLSTETLRLRHSDALGLNTVADSAVEAGLAATRWI